jgi:hypothetical protein
LQDVYTLIGNRFEAITKAAGTGLRALLCANFALNLLL